MGICSAFGHMEAFHFVDIFSLHLPRQANFYFVFWVALVAISFYIKKEENLAWHTSSKDSMTSNLGKMAASFSKSVSDEFFFVRKWYVMFIFFLLFLCSTTHIGVQLVLEVYQGGNPFALVETGIHYRYTWAGSTFSSSC